MGKSRYFWNPLPGWFLLRWAVYVVLAYLLVMLIYGTLFRNAQPWLLDVFGAVAVGVVVGGAGLLVARRRHLDADRRAG